MKRRLTIYGCALFLIAFFYSAEIDSNQSAVTTSEFIGRAELLNWKLAQTALQAKALVKQAHDPNRQLANFVGIKTTSEHVWMGFGTGADETQYKDRLNWIWTQLDAAGPMAVACELSDEVTLFSATLAECTEAQMRRLDAESAGKP